MFCQWQQIGAAPLVWQTATMAFGRHKNKSGPRAADTTMPRERRARPLDATKLSELAVAYVGRFATTRDKLRHYLRRKLAERGWTGDALPDIEALVDRLVDLGAVDDAAYAVAKAGSLTRRGYGARRVDQAIRAAGVGEADREEADALAVDAKLSAALRFAEKRRAGPYALVAMTDPKARERMIGAFARAGHDTRLARAIVALAPGAATDGLEN
jgi:regulatory protein